MLRNYLLIALRTLRRYRDYALLNVGGLALGLSSGMLIFLLVKFQLSFDDYHAKGSRTYQITTEFYSDGVGYSAGVPTPMSLALRNDFPFLEHAAMRIGQYNRLIAVPDAAGRPVKKFNEDNIVCFVEPQFFEVFDYQWLKGNPRTALTAPKTVVLTERLAKKYFGEADPIGHALKMSNDLDLKVTGVVADIPQNTDNRHELFIAFETIKNYRHGGPGLDNWGGVNSDTHCFVTLPPGSTPDRLEKAMVGFTKKYHPKDYKTWGHPVNPYRQMHFSANYGQGITTRYLWALALVGVFLVLTACINFINLATAQALRRSKEVGVRKVVGGTRTQVFWQFIAETGLIVAFSAVLALVLVQLVQPGLNAWVQEHAGINFFGPLDLLHDWQLWVGLLLAGAAITFLSGSYPGLVLAGFGPVQALKGRITARQVGGLSLRRGLVVLQFVLTQVLLISTLVVSEQMAYFRQKDIGFKPQALVMLEIPTPDKTNLSTLENRFRQVPGVESVTFCQFAPTSGSNNTTDLTYDTRQRAEVWSVNTKPADQHYLETFGLKLVAGQNLPQSDTIRGFMVNETFVKRLGGTLKPADVVGKNLKVSDRTAPIVGVLKDWNNLSLHNEIQPVVLFTSKDNYYTCGLKVSTATLQPTLAAVEKIWNQAFPDFLYERTFLDERIARFYQTEDLLLQFIRGFAGIAIFIGCLGLYGLVSFMAAQKTKEIGVRKVLGASIGQILTLFGREFGALVALAFGVAAPLGWWLMSSWLQDFTYRVPIGAGVFALAIGLTASIAALTVGYQSLKAARANPVKSLRTE